MNAPLNLVWLLVDSVRTYRSGRDLRDKLDVMDRFGERSIEFRTCVTTAPSTVMSITAMMTGLPAYFLARNYDHFRFDNRHYPGLSDVLKHAGYACCAFLRGPETREKFENLLEMVPREHWAPHLRHGFKWRNEDLNMVLDNLLQRGVPRPAFFFFHFNPQTRSQTGEPLVDPQVSEAVEWAWQRLERAGFTSENTVYVLCSDHGFPDPSTGLTSEWEAKYGLAHDLVLTDDNILIPLYIRCPGCAPRRIDTPVSSLDLFPTLLDLLNVPDRDHLKAQSDGMSLLPLMRSPNEAGRSRRFFRCDSRLMLQEGRSTAIRGERYTYIRFHDEWRFGAAPSGSGEVLINLCADPTETRNLLLTELAPDAARALEALRNEFDRTEQRALEYQIEYLLSQLDLLSNGSDSGTDGANGTGSILAVFEPNTAAFDEIGVRALARLYPRASVHMITGELQGSMEMESRGTRVAAYRPGADTSPTILSAMQDHYDLGIVFARDEAGAENIRRHLPEVGVRRWVALDCNFESYRRPRFWYYRARALLHSLPSIRREPELLLLKLRNAARVIGRRLFRTARLRKNWEMASEESAPRR